MARRQVRSSDALAHAPSRRKGVAARAPVVPSFSLFGEALRAAVEPWRTEVARVDVARLDALVGIATTERTRLSECVRVTFADHRGKKAVAALSSFRKRINDVAQEAKLPLRFRVDTKVRSPPEQRECWFTGPDPAIASATAYSDQVTSDVEGQPLVQALGIPTTGSAMAAGKRLVRFFLSYAHANKKLVEWLLAELKEQFSACPRYEYQVWSDGQILLGARWRESIEQAIRECDFGLLLISPSFLGSELIKKHELPRFVGGPGQPGLKQVIPVGLMKVHKEHHDLRGLDELQIFRQRGRHFFDDRATPRDRRAFAFELFTEIQKRLDAVFGPVPGQQPERMLDEAIPLPEEETRHFQRTRGYSVKLGDLEQKEQKQKAAPDQARDALAEIERWIVNPDAPPFFALLGEYGIGKTTTLKRLTRDLLSRRGADKALPLPLYVDLRDYAPPEKDAVPAIEELLASVIKRSWKLKDRSATPEGVLRLVREEGAVIFFDGLDERIVHLPPDRARLFIRTLWSVLPDVKLPGAQAPGKRRGKLLISCRSHYFPDVWSQNGMLVGEDREGMKRGEFPAFCLVPFSEEQIGKYLESLLDSEERAAAAVQLIASVHNLSDLAQRPYLLNLIAEQLSELEGFRARGEKVNAARLYDGVVRRWLGRDDGKHQIQPAHKRRMMEDLAAAFWRSGSKQWKAEKLEEWLDGYLQANPAMADGYRNKDPAVLKEDLRTATFVLRPDREKESFRFAHTSFQEYFLAAYLARALENGQPERWDLPMVSDETLDFLGQILSLDEPASSLRTMEAILGGNNLPGALLAFRYWLRALETSMPVPAPSKVKLAGANLEEWTIRGLEGQQPLSLRGANLSGAKLNRARVEHVNLIEANLDGLQARQALFRRVNGARASARRVDFGGLRWRDGSLHAASLAGARLSGCHWIKVDLSGADLPAGWQKEASAVLAGQFPPHHPALAHPNGLTSLGGHSGWVRACGFSPDGQRLVSGSDDNTLKVWDSSSGECLLTLQGHSGWVRACGFSPDGQRLVSGSFDNTLKVWDSSSGECLWTGHVFPEGQVATIDGSGQHVTHATPDAWRWLGWRVKDPDTGRLRILPYETFATLR